MWTIFIFILFIIIWTYKFQRPANYPPGPTQLPVIGNLLSVWWKLRALKYHHLVWQSWSQKYGPVLGLRLGLLNVVIISGKEMIKEVSSMEVFDGRPDSIFYTMRSYGQKIGVVFSEGPVWNRTRRTVLRGLKNFGFGTSVMEKYISEECKALIELHMADAGKPVYANHMFDVCVVNILWRLVAGKRYDLEDQKLKYLCNTITRIFRVVDMSGGIMNFMPFLRHIVPGLIGYTELMTLHATLINFLKETIEEHRQTIDFNKPRDIIDTLLIEMTHNNYSYSEQELQVICRDFLEAGMETVSNTAGFLMLYLVSDQGLQERLMKEIDAEIGNTRPPALSDRPRMIYTEAVILEALRITSVASMAIPHKALNKARIGNYDVPKGTIILLSLYDMHNGAHWTEPTTFRPERFLTEDGNLIQDDWLMPFGCGRRRCIGEGLSRNELFLFVTNILQNFSLKLPEGASLPNPEPVNGITLSAKDFKVVFQPRANYSYCS